MGFPSPVSFAGHQISFQIQCFKFKADDSSADVGHAGKRNEQKVKKNVLKLVTEADGATRGTGETN